MRFNPLFNRPWTRPPADDAHAPDAVVQWWYFDAVLKNGMKLMTFFLPRLLGITDGHDPDHAVGAVADRPQGSG